MEHLAINLLNSHDSAVEDTIDETIHSVEQSVTIHDEFLQKGELQNDHVVGTCIRGSNCLPPTRMEKDLYQPYLKLENGVPCQFLMTLCCLRRTKMNRKIFPPERSNQVIKQVWGVLVLYLKISKFVKCFIYLLHF